MIPKDIEAYALEHTTDDSPVVQALIKAAEEELEHTDMLSGRQVGRLLSIMVKISGARRILEVGTFAGYSALTMAEALPEDGELLTCEYNERYEEIARKFFNKSEHGSKITLVMGMALETIPTIPGYFDLIFLDADKINYPEYYDLLVPRLNKGGIMAIDNMLWGGEVTDPGTDKARAIDRLNKHISSDQTVEQVLLTVRDGITLVRKQ